jgi:carbonic anhydrase
MKPSSPFLFLTTLIASFGTLSAPIGAEDAIPAGKAQSPISIEVGAAAKTDLPNLVFKYQASKTNLENNGHSVQATIDKWSTLEALGKTYSLVQFHLHASSEHTLEGKSYPLEMHLVHKDAEGKLAVVGVFIEEGEANPALDVYFNNLPQHEGEKYADDAILDLTKALPADKTFFTYSGSLTTPILALTNTEGVTWFVLKTPMKASKEQIAKYTGTKHLSGTNRKLQDLNNRKVQLDSSP